MNDYTCRVCLASTRQFTVLPYQEFVLLKERLEEMEDLLQLRKAKKVGSALCRWRT